MLNKKQFNALLNMSLERGKDYSLSIQINNNCMYLTVYTAGSNERLMLQEDVLHPETDAIVVDFKNFLAIIDKIKMVQSFMFYIIGSKVQVKIFDKSDIEIDNKYIAYRIEDVPVKKIAFDTPDPALCDFEAERVNAFEKCKINLELAPELCKVSLLPKDDKMYLFSTDGISILKLEWRGHYKFEEAFSFATTSPVSLKNIRLFQEVFYYHLFVFQDETFCFEFYDDYGMKYWLPIEVQSDSFYRQKDLQFLVETFTYEPLFIDLQEEDVKKMKALMTSIKKDCEKEEKYEVVIQVKNDGLYFHDTLVYPIHVCDNDFTCLVNGYDLMELLMQFDTEIVGKKKQKKYSIQYHEYHSEQTGNTFVILKNHDLYMITKQ